MKGLLLGILLVCLFCFGLNRSPRRDHSFSLGALDFQSANRSCLNNNSETPCDFSAASITRPSRPLGISSVGKPRLEKTPPSASNDEDAPTPDTADDNAEDVDVIEEDPVFDWFIEPESAALAEKWASPYEDSLAAWESQDFRSDSDEPRGAARPSACARPGGGIDVLCVEQSIDAMGSRSAAFAPARRSDSPNQSLSSTDNAVPPTPAALNAANSATAEETPPISVPESSPLVLLGSGLLLLSVYWSRGVSL